MGGRVSTESPTPPKSPIPDDSQKPDKADPTKEVAEEEEEECGFRAFMKGGECKDFFIDWEKCIEVEKRGGDPGPECIQKVDLLFECMNVHYGAAKRAIKKEDAAAAAGAEEKSEKEASVTPESRKRDVAATGSEKVSREDLRS